MYESRKIEKYKSAKVEKYKQGKDRNEERIERIKAKKG